MGNSICIESEPTYLLRLPSYNTNLRSNSSFGGLSNNNNNKEPYSSRSAYSEGGSSNYNSHRSGYNSARSSGVASATSVPQSAFDGFDHNIKTIGFELRDNRLQYRFPDIGQNLSSVQNWRKQAYDLSHLALIVLRVSRKPPDNKDFVVTSADATSLYTFASLCDEVFSPRGRLDPRSIEIPNSLQWRASSSSSSSASSSSSPPSMALYLYRGKRAHPRAIMEAMLVLNQIERNFIHDPVGLQDLFFNRLSGAYPCSLQYMQGGWDSVATGNEASNLRQNNHLLRALLGKLNSSSSSALHGRVDSFSQQISNLMMNSNNNNSGGNNTTSSSNNNNNNHLRTNSFHNNQQQQQHSRNVSGVSPSNNNNNNNNANIQDNTLKLSDLKPLALANSSTPQQQNHQVSSSSASGTYDEIIRSRTVGDFSKEVAKAMRDPTPTNTNNASSSSMDHLTGAQRSSLALNIPAPEERQEDYPVDDREMRLRRAAPLAVEVLPGLYVGGEMPSKNRQLLKSKNITHVINCAAGMLENKFPEDFEYTSLNLSDSADEPIQFLFPHVVEIIDRVLEIERGSVFVHCHQGVSRSCTFVISYVMWKQGLPYNNAYKFVRERRDVCSPNAGFMCNLMRWEDMLANSAKFALIEYGPYRKDMQWPFIWRVRFPNHIGNTNTYDDDDEEQQEENANAAERLSTKKPTTSSSSIGQINNATNKKVIEIDHRTCSALVSFGEGGTSAKLFKGESCPEALFEDALERLQSWVLFGNFSNSGASSTHYLLVEYLNAEDVQIISHKKGDVEIGSGEDDENSSSSSTFLSLSSTERKEFSDILSTSESYEESKQNFMKEQEKLLNKLLKNSKNQHQQQQAQLQLPNDANAINNNQQLPQKMIAPINLAGTSSSSSSNNNNNNHNNNSTSQIRCVAKQQQQINNNNNVDNTVSSTTAGGGGTSPDVSQEIRSSNTQLLNANFNNSSFIALRGPEWEPIGETDLLDWEDFDPEEVYLFFIQPKSSRELGKIYMWVGEDSGWGSESCVESYDLLVKDAKNFIPNNNSSGNNEGDVLEDDDGVSRGLGIVHELLKHRAFESQRMMIIREREEPDDFVALF